jgi:hypothetical protein
MRLRAGVLANSRYANRLALYSRIWTALKQFDKRATDPY